MLFKYSTLKTDLLVLKSRWSLEVLQNYSSSSDYKINSLSSFRGKEVQYHTSAEVTLLFIPTACQPVSDTQQDTGKKTGTDQL